MANLGTVTKVRQGMFLFKLSLRLGKSCVLDTTQIFPNYRCLLVYNKVEEISHVLDLHFTNKTTKLPVFPDEIETVWATKNDVEKQMKKKLVDQTDATEEKRLCWSAVWKEPNPEFCISCDFVDAEIEIVIKLESYSDDVTRTNKRLKSVHEAVKQIRENQALADVKFLCQNETILGHSSILSAGSPVLAAMFRHEFQEKQEMVVEITDITADVFKQLLQFLYIQDADLHDFKDVAGLLVAAEKYNVDLLKEECEINLSENLNFENYSHYLVLAHIHKAPKLFESSLEFMAFNAKEICFRGDEWLRIIKDYPELIFEATKRMVFGHQIFTC